MAESTSKKELLRIPRNRTIRTLNDVYVVAGLTIQALRELEERVSEGEQEDEVEFEAPSANGQTTTVTRDVSRLLRLLGQARGRSVFEQSLVTAVAMTEDYLQTTLKSVLKWFPEKIKTSVDGKHVEKSVDLDLVLKSATIDEVIDAAVRKQLLSVFYGSPERYFQYIESVLSIKIEAGLKDSFVEVKATRDIIVHNAGVANDTYVEKAGTKARAKPGEQLKNNDVYFGDAIRCMKGLIEAVYSKTVAKFAGTRRRRVKRQA